MRSTLAMLMILALVAPLSFTGCDRTVSETTKTSSDSAGNVKQETKTIKQSPDGDITVTNDKTERRVDNP